MQGPMRVLPSWPRAKQGKTDDKAAARAGRARQGRDSALYGALPKPSGQNLECQEEAKIRKEQEPLNDQRTVGPPSRKGALRGGSAVA
eukprot:CAMPEP_0179168226 /NCGR_PEP_ID=MMETSP0796-20121207/82744_1 /TAXON_ID=73915 /ORGANISM="Pyrodinium bahamense, Strain pbaha01" /LENGTH=87 /DNA_ID=CAMNT_0020870977 /DNA_START=22 /DNA_END=284 /DNA_ORIENTATION=-